MAIIDDFPDIRRRMRGDPLDLRPWSEPKAPEYEAPPPDAPYVRMPPGWRCLRCHHPITHAPCCHCGAS
jgi:hypothetical protein